MTAPRVRFVAPSAYVLSGLATWLDYLVPGLVERGVDARVLLVSGPAHHRPERYLAEHPLGHVGVVHCRTGTSEGRVQALASALSREAPDLVVSVNIPDVFPAVNRLRRRGAAVRVATSVHGIEAFLYADLRRYRAIVDGAICTNRLACELAVALGELDAARVSYAPYGVRASGEEFAATPPAGRLRIVYAGRLETPQKRARDLVPIVAALERRELDFELLVAGDGPDADFLAEALAEPVRRGRVRLLGHVSAGALEREVYAKSHVLLVTSSWETGPIVAWEAMAQGLAVVSSRYIGSGREDALQDGENALLFAPGDVEAAAAAIERLYRAPALWTALTTAGRELIRARYSVPASVDAWHRALQALLAREPLAAAPAPALPAAGRLDPLLGPRFAELVRKAIPGVRRAAPDPGGEWPHAHSKAPSDGAFWTLAAQLDRRVPGATARVA